MKPPADFRSDLKAWRDRMGITQAEAAQMLDIPRRTLTGYESASRPAEPKPAGPVRKLMAILETYATTTIRKV